MKKSSIFHGISIGAGIWGALALGGAWLAGGNGAFLGFPQTHLFYDAIALTLISISAGICALYRMHAEQHR